MRLTGITRSPTYSPFQHEENDIQILCLTADALRRRGCQIQIITEDEVERTPINSRMVFSMCQGPSANRHLMGLVRKGLRVINDPLAVQFCYRENLYPFLGAESPLVPRTLLVNTSRPEQAPLSMFGRHPVWLKRGDVHAVQKGDVVRVQGYGAYRQTIEEFHKREIQMAAIQEHVPGQVVKFYGVMGTDFFRYYAEDDHLVIPEAFSHARPAVESLVRQLGLEIYGGDAVITNTGEVKVIDVNDWPSYAYFREEAAEAIATQIIHCTETATQLPHGVPARQGPRPARHP